MSSARKSLADDSPLPSGFRSIDNTARNASPDLIHSQLISLDKTQTVQLSKIEGTPRIEGDQKYVLESNATSPDRGFMTGGMMSDRTFQYKSEPEDPKLVVSVKIGEKRTEQIIIYEGDDAEQLAADFCAAYELDDSMQDKLVPMLKEQMATVLSRIPEDADLEGEEAYKNT